MKYYQDITLLEKSNITWFSLWSKSYQKIHLSIIETMTIKKTSIGVCFPEYQDNILLGSKLRIFTKSETDLIFMNIQKYLSHLQGNVLISTINPVPQKIERYACFSRYQPTNTNKERLARRRAKRKNESYEKALNHYQTLKPTRIKEPFIRLNSLSTGKEFNLFIKKTQANSLINNGFSSYGLSNSSTVPDF